MASTALTVGSLVLAVPAEADDVTSLTPPFSPNDATSVTITFTTTNLFPQRSRVELVRVGGVPAKGDQQVTYTTDSIPTRTPHATFNLADGGDGEKDGPANPGTYSVNITQGPYDEFGLTSANPAPETDTCVSCFSIFASGPPQLASIEPAAMSVGEATNATIRGSGFTRGTKMEALLPDGTVDTNVLMNEAPFDAYPDPNDPRDQAACAANADTAPCTVEFDDRTTAGEMARRIQVNPGAATGTRSVRVVNTDGATTTCQSCFTVAGQPLQGVAPNAASNDSPNLTRVDFFGSNLPANVRPQLAYIAQNAGSSTKTALSLDGTNVTYSPTRVSADFDIRNAAPGTNAYQPTLVGPEGATHSCGCRFSVAQPQAASVTSVNPASAAQGETVAVDVTGGRLSRGVRLDFGSGITVVSVEYVSSTAARAQLTVASTAAAGPRNVLPQTTDGKVGTGCGTCFSVTGDAVPSPTASPSPTARPCPSAAARVSVNTPTIIATGRGSVTVTDATPHAQIELQGYSQNHEGTMSFANDPTPVDRSRTADATGSITFSDLRPGTNTRLRAREVGCAYGGSAVMEVRTQLSLEVQRTGRRAYTFSGNSMPARAGGLVVSLYRVVGTPCSADDPSTACAGEVLIGQARADAVTGQYAIPVRFGARDQGVRDEFVVKTGRDNQNAPGRSNTRSLVIS